MIKKFINGLAKRVLWLAALILCSTFRIKKSNSAFFEEYRKGKRKSVVAFWHGSMLVGWFLHRPEGGARVSALVSQSKDGEILSTVLARWGYDLIRGSSHIGGKGAMQLMAGAIDGGQSLAITPDGPTGPRHQMKMGAVRAAQRAHVPLFLVGIAAQRKKKLKSWDQFEIPMPFSRIAVHYSDPILVPDHLQNESLDLFLAETQHQLLELNTRAEQTVQGS
jgi:lysophospholipid acyltransferase (LPLAT)-like uncharacterized protein